MYTEISFLIYPIWRLYESFKNINFINDLPPRFNLIKSMACGLALLASGQAVATNYSSKTHITGADLTSVTNWTEGSPPCGGSTPFAINLTNADSLIMCPGHSLTLAATDTVAAGALLFGAGATWGSGTLTFDSADKAVVSYTAGSVAITTLNLSSMTLGNTITIMLAAAGDAISFGSVTGGKSLECPSGTPYTAGTAITNTTGAMTTITCTVVASAAPPPINAPIDLHFSKQVETFATEIELK